MADYNKKRVLPTQQLRLASSAMGRTAIARTMQPARDALLRQVGKRIANKAAAVKTVE
ncbi:hypothetical protein ACPFL9_11925 [Paenarthrobacter sp. NyZ202]|uniref:hypothetical protein n=1 Tax=Paenarthrobacter sp. NyZ202 TaxID=3402689 RepID=UPI003CED13EA